MLVQEMLATHPRVTEKTNDQLIRCIEACHTCAHACTACADACLAEDMVAELRSCIRRDLDCADLCRATASIMTRRTGGSEPGLPQLLDACAAACAACAEECDHHAEMHEHCRICAEACRECEAACRDAAASVH